MFPVLVADEDFTEANIEVFEVGTLTPERG
jgi:hypothetical protein